MQIHSTNLVTGFNYRCSVYSTNSLIGSGLNIIRVTSVICNLVKLFALSYQSPHTWIEALFPFLRIKNIRCKRHLSKDLPDKRLAAWDKKKMALTVKQLSGRSIVPDHRRVSRSLKPKNIDQEGKRFREQSRKLLRENGGIRIPAFSAKEWSES